MRSYFLSRRFIVSVAVLAATIALGATLAFVVWSKESAFLLSLVGIALNFAALLAAIVLGWGGFRVASQQAEDSRRTTVLSYRPLLVPVHESAGPAREQGGKQFFPAMDGIKLEQSARVARTFRVAGRPDFSRPGAVELMQAWIHLRNVGQGPAIVREIIVWNLKGQLGELVGPGSIGPASCEVFVGDLDTALTPEKATSLQQALGPPGRWSGYEPDRVYFLKVTYSDVFGSQPCQQMQAWFDPVGLGHWQVLSDLSDFRT